MAHPPPNPAGGATGTKVEHWLNHCVHRIATGQWAEGEKLPSVRAAKQRWGVDAQTVLRVYEQLERRGLVDRRPRSGFYVRRGDAVGRLLRHRHELENLFDRCSALVRDATDLSPLGVFRYFAALAEIRDQRQPECAFLECTAAQAAGHAEEVHRRLGVPCLPLTTGEIDGRRARVPGHVRTLLVSAFHWHEAPVAGEDDGRLDLVRVGIELDPELVASLRSRGGVLFEFEQAEGEGVLDDLRAHGYDGELELSIVDDIDRSLAEHADRGGDRLALLSPRAWGRAAVHWRRRAFVHQVAYRIAESAWPAIANHIGLPLGALA